MNQKDVIIYQLLSSYNRINFQALQQISVNVLVDI